MRVARRAVLAAMATATPRSSRAVVVDSHLHVWSSSHPYAKGGEPPAALGDAVASAAALETSMASANIDAALIVQPINYRFDHAHVASVLKAAPQRYRGMALANPTAADPGAALREACASAPGLWTGVRFNPYLWPDDAKKSAWLADAAGLSLLEVCHDLSLPIGVMAFGGLPPLLPSITALLEHPKAVPIVIDHWGFPREDPAAAPSPDLTFDGDAFDALCALGRRHDNLYLKLSALFRVSGASAPHSDLKPRFDRALGAFGPDRLMWGSDFPFVQLQPGGQRASLEALRSFTRDLPAPARDAILGGTAAKLFRFDACAT